MRYAEILNEAAVDFAAVTSHHEDNIYAFTFPVVDGGWIQVDAAVYLSKVISIKNIATFGEHSDNFEPRRKTYKIGTRIGTTETRRMLRFVVDTIRQDYPNVNKIAGDRLTGARADVADSMTSMAI